MRWPPAGLLHLFVLRKRRAKDLRASVSPSCGGDEVGTPQIFFFFSFALVFKIKMSCSIFCDNPESVNIETADSSLETEGLICE